MTDRFRRFSAAAAGALGSPWASVLAVLFVLGWAACGPLFGFSENWQLTINTGTTIITFLMVFVIQSSQNRDAKAMQLKMDELIRISAARNRFVGIEAGSEEELKALEEQFRHVRESGASIDVSL